MDLPIKIKLYLISLVALTCLLSSCENDNYTPKPKAYFRIDLPEKKYTLLDKGCPFTFEIPTYATTKPDINAPNEPCWFNIDFNPLNASIYMSYKSVNGDLNTFLEDSRTLAFKHTVKAYDIEQQIINIPTHKVYGIVYQIEGNAASSYQFHLTDSVHHFVRGSLYFNNIPNQDSIQPVLDFIKQDIEHIFETFEWK
ncbi:MAG: gliding motility lipoprotein GldD [Flavobacteriales bacterium CG_4_10_14_0_2_um_filter_32_8]|nr:MAG: gliding motility lipoprotein GldD [Flavobacteriales bacterium CG_4_10_14_0_2_um_filter_32_8]